MKCKMIRIALSEAKDRLNRTIFVKEDVNIAELIIIIGTALNCEFSALPYLEDSKNIYFVGEDEIETEKNCLDGFKYVLTSLEDRFLFKYITEYGEIWTFECIRYQKTAEKDEECNAYLVDGKGQGIWEDGKEYLLRYLNGEIAANTTFKNKAYDYDGPFSFNDKRYGDFDTKFDLKKEAKSFNDLVSNNVLEMLIIGDEDNENSIEKRLEGPFESDYLNVCFFAYKASMNLVENNETIGEEFGRLENSQESHKVEYATDAMVQEYLHEMYESLKENRSFSEEKLCEKLKKIK